MDKKRRRNIKTLETDLPGHITTKASDAFDKYIRNQKQRRLNNNERTNVTTQNDNSAENQTHVIDHQADITDYTPVDQDNQRTLHTDPNRHNEDEGLPSINTDDLQQASLLQHEEPAEIPENHEQTEEELESYSHEEVPAGQQPQLNDPPIFIKQLKKGLHYAASWASVLAFLSVTGRTRHSRDQYFILESAVRTASDDADNMLSYSSVRENQTKYFDQHCFPTSQIIWIPCENLKRKQDKLINRIKTADGQIKDARECVKVVLPSAWARYDLSLHPMYTDLIEGDHYTDKTKISIEQSPLVTNRDHAIGNSSSFWAQYKNTITNVDMGTQLSIELSGPLPEDNSLSQWPTEHRDGKHFLTCTTGPQWCVTKTGFPSRRTSQLDITELSAEEQQVYNYFRESDLCIEGFIAAEEAEKNAMKKGKSTHSIKQSIIKPKISPTSIFPTDVCVFLRSPVTVPSQNEDRRVICLLVSSFLAKITGQPSERIIWISYKSTTDTTIVSISNKFLRQQEHINFHHTSNVSAVPIVHKDNITPIKLETEESSTPTGYLADGTKYVIYRFALYADEFGFNEVCGCYILLLGAAQHNRISSAGVRALTLVPKHQSVNKILNLILDDIHEGMVNGFPSTDPNGQPIRVFLDMCQAFGDYVKITAITNTGGHRALSFCTFCRILKNTINLGPMYAYSNLIHSRRMSFMRFDERTDILFTMNLSTQSKQKLGLKFTQKEEAKKQPMVHFSEKLYNTKHRVPLTENGQPVVSQYCDSFLSTAVAPDHLLSGLINVLLEACFRSLPDNNTRKIVEQNILQSADDNNLPTNGKFLLFKDSAFKGLSSMTMSTLYVVLLFASTYFKDLSGSNKYDTQNILDIPMHLQHFISTYYYWPDISVDSESDVAAVQRSGRATYLGKLKTYAFAYSSAVERHMKRFGENALLRDRPNSHRLIELAVHTVPIYGHGKLTSELILELTHAFFKSWFTQNNHSNSHITGLNFFISRTWSANLYILYHMWKESGKETNSLAFRNLLRLFFGEKASALYTSADPMDTEVHDLVDTFKVQLDNIIRSPVSDMLVENIPTSFLAESVRWVPRSKCKASFNTVLDKAFAHLSTELQRPIELLRISAKFYESASLTVKAKYGMGQRTYPYKTIYDGTPIILHVPSADEDKPVITEVSDGKGVQLATVVQRVFVYDKVHYIVTCDLQKISGNQYKMDRTKVRVIKLQLGITRVAYVLSGIMDKIQNEEESNREYTGNSLAKGEVCHILLKRDGYPPCLG